MRPTAGISPDGEWSAIQLQGEQISCAVKVIPHEITGIATERDHGSVRADYYSDRSSIPATITSAIGTDEVRHASSQIADKNVTAGIAIEQVQVGRIALEGD
jgi:hypothetical protein